MSLFLPITVDCILCILCIPTSKKRLNIAIIFGIQFLVKYTKTVYLRGKLYTYTSSIIWYTKYTIKSFKYTVSVYQAKNCIPDYLPIYLILSVIGIQSIQSIQSSSKEAKIVYLRCEKMKKIKAVAGSDSFFEIVTCR